MVHPACRLGGHAHRSPAPTPPPLLGWKAEAGQSAAAGAAAGHVAGAGGVAGQVG